MKPKSKNISKSVLLLFMVMLGISFAKAQTHIKGAANCILQDAYVKEASKTRNAVSCVDCYCKVCGDKKEKAKQAKLKAEETASKQKTATPPKKTTATTKGKSDEAILVAPKPKVEENKNPIIKLSVKDREIVELTKKVTVKIKNVRDLDGNGYGWFYEEKVNISKPIDRIYYEENGQRVVLKDLNLKDYGYSYMIDNKLDENGNFCIMYTGYIPGKGNIDEKWSDIVTIQGENLLNDKTIWKITYKGNGIYDLYKSGEIQPSEQYNYKTKQRTSIK